MVCQCHLFKKKAGAAHISPPYKPNRFLYLIFQNNFSLALVYPIMYQLYLEFQLRQFDAHIHINV